jgi:hypothetical protein
MVAPWGRCRSPNCCKSLRSNADLVVSQWPTSKDVNMEAEEATLLEALPRDNR